jgi:transposase-like protein
MAERRGVIRRRSAEEWQELLTELAASGEEVDRFCRRHQLHPPTLRWWRWQLARRDLAATDRLSPSASRSPQFVEMRWREPMVADEAPVGFELRWSDGLALGIPRQFDEGALRRLLAVLEGARC